MSAMARTFTPEPRALGAALALLALVALGAFAALPDRAAAQVMDDHIFWKLTADELEYAPGPAERPVSFDGSFWIGGNYNRLWIKAKGERATTGDADALEAQLLYSRLVAPFWEAQAGVGVQTVSGGAASHTRGLLVLGFEGLAPYWFELEPQLLVSHEGDVAMALSASYDLLFTQRLVLEPELELAAAIQDVPEFGVGSGLNDLHLAARLRYEIVRELAPYVGVVWGRKFGATADLARAAGEGTDETTLVAGLRFWF
jgi:copper resistance protein B